MQGALFICIRKIITTKTVQFKAINDALDLLDISHKQYNYNKSELIITFPNGAVFGEL